jgi:hypothetical protein
LWVRVPHPTLFLGSSPPSDPFFGCGIYSRGGWANVALLAARAAVRPVWCWRPMQCYRPLGQHGATGPCGAGPAWRWRHGVRWHPRVRWRGPRHCHLITIALKLYKKLLRLHANKRASLVVKCPLSLVRGLRFNSLFSFIF